MNVLKKNIKEVNAVFIANAPCFLDAVAMLASTLNKGLDTYQNPQHFLDNVNLYPKSIKILLGQRYSNFDMTGIQIAEYLYELGFTQLYLCSSQIFLEYQVPNYLTVILKPEEFHIIKRILE